MKNKMIIDTDIGDDIDDLLALYLALESDKIDLLGVTTVFNNTNLRARQANKVLELKHRRDIPVYAGYGTPMNCLHSYNVNEIFCQYTPDLDSPQFAPLNNEEGCNGSHAIDFLIESAKKYKDELTIICIGPLTNIAKAIKKDKAAFAQVKFVIMGGCFFKACREWNIECDLDAAKIVMESRLDITMIGTNVTMDTELSDEMQSHFVNAKHNDYYYSYLVEAINLWVKATNRQIILHDPLVVYYAINKDIFETKRRHVYLETKGEFTKSMTLALEELLWVQFDYINKNDYAECDLAYKIDKDKFFQDYLKIVKI